MVKFICILKFFFIYMIEQLHFRCLVNNAATLVFAEAEWQTRAMISR